MIACVDVDYRAAGAAVAAVAAAVVIERWEDERPLAESTARIEKVADYQPGAFYLRELPCLLAVLEPLRDIDTVVIDGYVWLDGRGRPGLARACSKRFVTARGVDVARAADDVRRMHGAHRIPTILKRVDRLARES